MVDEIGEEESSHPQMKDKVSTMDSLELQTLHRLIDVKNQPWIFYLDQKKMKKALPSRMSYLDMYFQGIIVSKRRTCLKPENVDRILFLNKIYLH